MTTRCFAFSLLFSSALIAFTQTSESRHVIAVEVNSADARIRQILPSLRDEAVKAVEESAKNTRAVVMLGSAATSEEEARRNSADYLLSIELSIRPSAEFPNHEDGSITPTRNADAIGRVPLGITHSRCADLLGSAFTYSYKVVSLTGKNVKLQDSHTVRENEYPLGPGLECVGKLSKRAVQVDTSAAIHKLKSKRAL